MSSSEPTTSSAVTSGAASMALRWPFAPSITTVSRWAMASRAAVGSGEDSSVQPLAASTCVRLVSAT